MKQAGILHAGPFHGKINAECGPERPAERGIAGMMPYLWLAVLLVAAVIEMATVQLVSVWFAVGSFAAFIACLAGAPVMAQWVIFGVVSIVSLAAMRPLALRKFAVQKTRTNADRYLGKVALVTAEINNTIGTGQANVLGSIWTARSADGSVIPAGRHVLVESIDGVKLIVREKRTES